MRNQRMMTSWMTASAANIEGYLTSMMTWTQEMLFHQMPASTLEPLE